MKKSFSFVELLILLLSIPILRIYSNPGDAYGLISRQQTECELEALQIGTMLADRYNSLDEGTEWDVRIHNDWLAENLGFAGWISQGMWKTGGSSC